MDRILIVDDEERIRQLLYTLLTQENYDVRLAEDGEKGLDAMSAFSPQVVILDLNMPKMGGVEFLKRLQPGIDMRCSIIVLTGYGTNEDVQVCYRLGVQSFLRKPVNIHEILGLVWRNLESIHLSQKLEQEKKEKEQAYQLLKKTFDGMSEGVVTVDNDFRIRTISDKACRILGVSADQAVNKAAVSILGKPVAGLSGILMNVASSHSETSEGHTRLLLSNGAIVPVYLTVIPLSRNESREGWLLLFRDEREVERAAWERTGGTMFGRMTSNDNKMIEIFQLIDDVAPSKATVLIEGESGTGKELVAREIHDRSRRAQYRFLAVNCAAIPANLMESELFGYERGAFTGAEKRKPGRFELADGGTLFLDEIGELPLEMQVKLLRVLQERTFERIGGTTSIETDIRIVAATNHNLKELVLEGRFREDLYYRLDVALLRLPPLRDRLQDIPLLVSSFIGQLNGTESRDVKDVSPEVARRLLSYTWPGNVRELFHVIEYAFAVSRGDILQKEHLPVKLKPETPPSQTADSLIKNEKEILLQTLKQTSYDKKMAAGLLGMSLTTLYRRIKKHAL
ncbi:MAG: sigma-54-dependent Fis family transcriptional regulator [Proteobacteria bacterium]|nr:sigma-54-dependent Fis family transcriptional regulator [Pseudomonadota bacterium]